MMALLALNVFTPVPEAIKAVQVKLPFKVIVPAEWVNEALQVTLPLNVQLPVLEKVTAVQEQVLLKIRVPTKHESEPVLLKASVKVIVTAETMLNVPAIVLPAKVTVLVVEPPPNEVLPVRE